MDRWHGKPRGVSRETWRLALVLAEIALGRRRAGEPGNRGRKRPPKRKAEKP